MTATIHHLHPRTSEDRARAAEPDPASWLTPADIDAIRAVSWAAAITGLAYVGSRSVAVIQGAGLS